MKFDYILPVNNFIDRSILLDSPFNFPEELFDLLLLRANPQHRETWLIEPIRSLSRKTQILGNIPLKLPYFFDPPEKTTSIAGFHWQKSHQTG